MRKWLPAILPLFWSCADNLPDPVTVTPQLLGIDFPTVLVADWPVPLAFRVHAAVPEGDWSVALRVSGPGSETRDYLLLDDGDWLAIAAPGPGQEGHSGDNVAGDGWFTALIAADFGAGTGSYTLRARLLEGADEVDFRQVSRDCVDNRAPEILAFAAPDSLPSGGTFAMTLRAADPDGQEDLLPPQLRQSGGVMRSWPFSQTSDSTWSATVGPELAAGRQGLDTLLAVAIDRVGHETAQAVPVWLENGPPGLEGAALQFYQWMGASGFQPIDTGDTIHLFVPSLDPADTNFYMMTVPAFDPQTLADLTEVTWEISPVDGPTAPQVPMDDPLGAGLYEAYISLNGRHYNTTRYFVRFRAFDPFHQSATEERIIRIHNVGESPGGGGPLEAARPGLAWRRVLRTGAFR
jgi:hypothetical protein